MTILLLAHCRASFCYTLGFRLQQGDIFRHSSDHFDPIDLDILHAMPLICPQQGESVTCWDHEISEI